MIIERMAFHHSESVNGLLASMPIQMITPGKHGKKKIYVKLVTEEPMASINQLTWLMNRSVTL